MRITKTLLKKHKACESQVDLFDSLFPEGMDVTEESCMKALKEGVYFYLLYRHLLKDQKTHQSTKRHLRDEYEAAKKPLRDVYDAAIAPLAETYEAALMPLVDKYDKQLLLAFCKLFNEENP